jgi:hypothetical protein
MWAYSKLATPRPIISSLKGLLNLPMAGFTREKTYQVHEILAPTNDLKSLFKENRDSGETFARLMRVTASEIPEDDRTDVLFEVVCHKTSDRRTARRVLWVRMDRTSIAAESSHRRTAESWPRRLLTPLPRKAVFRVQRRPWGHCKGMSGHNCYGLGNL